MATDTQQPAEPVPPATDTPHPSDPVTRLSNAAKQLRIVAENVDTNGRLHELRRGVQTEMKVISRTGDGQIATARQDHGDKLVGLLFAASILLFVGFTIGYVVGGLG